jgi:hypothetical protein
MPIHDWTRVESGLVHHFHQTWTVALCNALNAGVLPADYFALAEQVISGPIPDVLTLRQTKGSSSREDGSRGAAVLAAPPPARFVRRVEPDRYARKANRVTVRHSQGHVVAVIEVVSPGNKDSRHALHTFVNKMTELLDQGVHLLVVDLFPPGKRDPDGVHKAIWDEVVDEPFELPPDKPLTLAAYQAGPVKVAYVEPVAVGDSLPSMPIFLEPEFYVPAPLEETYQTTWGVFPGALKGLLDGTVNDASG